MTQQKTRTLPIIVMFFLFAMISFVTNLAAPTGTIWGYQFEGNGVLGMMGNMMNFLAYLFMGIPAGNLLVKIGYKKTALWAMAVGVVGLFVQYLSSFAGAETAVLTLTGEKGNIIVHLNFFIYLLGAFICGFCVCMLNTVVNPMLNLLGGGGNKGNQLLQTGGALNSLSATLTPFFVGSLIGTLTKNSTMDDVAPLLWIAMGVFAFAFLVISFVEIPEPHLQQGKVVKEKSKYSPWSFRHTTLGVIAIFIYVGIEIGVPGTLNFYLADETDKGAGLKALTEEVLDEPQPDVFAIDEADAELFAAAAAEAAEVVEAAEAAAEAVTGATATDAEAVTGATATEAAEAEAEAEIEVAEAVEAAEAAETADAAAAEEQDAEESGASAIAGAIVAIYWLLMLVGRSLSSSISGKISTRTQLIAVSALGIVLVLLAITIPKSTTFPMPGFDIEKGIVWAQVPVSALFLVLVGLCTSVMWGGIFNLAVEGLGKYTAQASGIFMMMVVGGGILPLIQQGIAKGAGYMASYWLIVAALAYLLYYGLVGCKNVNKDIPVE